MAAAVAVHAEKALCEDAAVEMGAELALDEARHRCVLLAGADQEGLELLADDLVQERLLGGVALVLEHAASPRDRAWAAPGEGNPAQALAP